MPQNGEIQLSNDSDTRVAGCIISVRRTGLYSCVRALTYLLTQLVRGVSLKWCKIGSKLLLTTNRNMYTRFWSIPNSMTLNYLWARFKVIYSLIAAKMAKYSLVMTPTPCGVAEGIISIGLRIHAPCTYLLAHSLTYLHRITSVLETGLWSSCLTF